MLSLLLLFVPGILAAPAGDLVQNLPGLNFQPNFTHYSGYLKASATRNFHYWFTSSMQNPSKDPLVLWLNGGPGCSSVGGLIEECGPFHVSDFGNTVYLNRWAWNTFANVLFIESPAGVGFSYATDGNVKTNDDEVALNNWNALVDFLGKFPEFKGRDFYITGESYGGVYLPTLAVNLIKDKANFPNFKGMAVGNGIISFPKNTNTQIPLFYQHGILRDELYQNIASQCCKGSVETCDIDGLFNSFTQNCKNLVNEALAAANSLDPYNLYDTCYTDGLTSPSSEHKRDFIQKALRKRAGMPHVQKAASVSAATPLCAQSSNTETYMNRQDVRTALHIPSSLPHWTDCSNKVGNEYSTIYSDMINQVETIQQAGVRILFYNGDVDTVCNHVMNQQFITSLNYTIIGRERSNEPWRYNGETPSVAGMEVQYTGNVDFLTVRGSGHFVPEDRPREALQMIYNFVNQKAYSTGVPFQV